MRSRGKDRYFWGSVADFKKTGGWIIGQFMGERGFPLLETDEFEVAWKRLPAEFDEKPHFHRQSVEVNIVVSGSYRLVVGGEKIELGRGDFLVVFPETILQNLSADEGTEVVVIKSPSIPKDKFDIEN